MVSSPAELYGQAEMVIKVKEPRPLRKWPCSATGQIVFTYFHFAADGDTEACRFRGAAVAYETLPTDAAAAASDPDERSGRAG